MALKTAGMSQALSNINRLHHLLEKLVIERHWFRGCRSRRSGIGWFAFLLPRRIQKSGSGQKTTSRKQ
jgi:hypothetical protein